MISPVSFTSTYKVTNQKPNTDVRFNTFKNYAERKAKQVYFADTVYKKEIIKKSFFGSLPAKEEETLIVPDDFDKKVEEFCARNGIKFEKLYAHDLLDARKIKSRIQEAPRGYRKVEVDSKKFERLVQNQEGNISALKKDYKQFYTHAVMAKILEGSDFPATILRINPIEGLNQDRKTTIDFVKSEDNTDCYIYFMLDDLYLDKIPVYVDDLTYKAGTELGLFIEEKYN